MKDRIKERLEKIVRELKAKGGILILQTDEGAKIAQIGLSPSEIQDDLCLAIYYAKKIDLDEQYQIANSPLN